MSIKQIIFGIFILISLLSIVYLAVWVRLGTINSPTVLDYDPWWFYRYAKEIVENNFQMPKWDIQSFYPPGRFAVPFQGWSYTIALMYKFLNYFTTITLTKVAILSPLIMVALIPIPAFFIGKILSNSIGGLAVALFSVLTPTFLGVSMAGYSDSDVPVVFYTFLSILSILLVLGYSRLKWKSIPFYIFAILANLLFVFNWGGGWLALILFLAFIPALIVFRLIEQIFHTGKFKLHLHAVLPELKSIIIPLSIIFIITNIIGYLLWQFTMFNSLFGGLSFTGLTEGGLIVNVSVAELQTLSIFTKDGFLAVAERVGLAPFIITLIGLPAIVLYKLYKKKKINFIEIFLFLWALVMFYLISRGIRFSLLFSIATAVSSGYVIGNLMVYLKKKPLIITSLIFGIISVLTFVFISNAIQFSYSASGMQISQNWYNMLDWLKTNADKDSLISTWWDPGHIITGYTGLKVHADGAHCPSQHCKPYDHNVRIRDMGRIFSTNNESEAVSILSKYKELTPEQCEAVREKFKDSMPEDACKPVSDIYVIASSDLIGKYYWMSYFGSYDEKTKTGNGKNFMQIPFSGFDKSGLPTYGGIITLIQKENQILGVINIPQQGIRNAIIMDIIYFQQGQEIRYHVNATNQTNTMDGMLWVDPSFQVVIFMEPSVRSSMFTNMFFFNGEGVKEFNIPKLEHFQLVYSNPEIRIFKIEF